MPQRSYEVRIADPFGNDLLVLGLGAHTTLELAYGERQVGALTLELPGTYDQRLFQRDGQIQVLRALDGGAPVLEGERAWLIRKVSRLVSAGGRRSLRIAAVDGMDLLRRRIVDYDVDTSEADKTGPADDLIKAIVRENLVSATDSTRRLSSSLFAVAADAGAGASVSKVFARRTVLDVCRELAEASTLAGVYCSFDVVWTGSRYELRTYTGQRGVDHSGVDRVLIGPDFRNLTDVEDTDDALEEATRAIVGGEGTGADRAVARSDDTVRQGASPFGLIEVFGTQNGDDVQLADEADSLLRASRPRRVISGTFVDTPGVTYGRHINFGDLVVAQVADNSAICRIDTVRIAVEGNKEMVDLRLRSST